MRTSEKSPSTRISPEKVLKQLLAGHARLARGPFAHGAVETVGIARVLLVDLLGLVVGVEVVAVVVAVRGRRRNPF
jgi:hypothetical protein